jgi:hypothetical protein
MEMRMIHPHFFGLLDYGAWCYRAAKPVQSHPFLMQVYHQKFSWYHYEVRLALTLEDIPSRLLVGDLQVPIKGKAV